jgi:hypothetical protein
MKTYHVDVRPQEHTVQPNIEQINNYFHTMSARNCQLVVCVMNGRNEDELKQLKSNIKDCGTITYGMLFLFLLPLTYESYRYNDTMCRFFKN